jgi:hypothetical protein
MFKHSQHKLFSAARNDCTLAFRPPIQHRTEPAVAR